MPTQRHLGVLALSLASLLACAQVPRTAPDPTPPREASPDPAEPVPPRTFVFRCGESGDRVVVSHRGDTAWVFVREGTFALPPVPSASGVRFSNGEVVYWREGARARVETPERTYVDCQSRPGEAVWEAARLDGVHFRAIGQEPGWSLEIRDDRIDLVLDYGRTKVSVPVEMETGDRWTTYRSTDDEHDVTVVLRGTPCTDTMSGERFETTVGLRVDGRDLRGCGRPLH